MMLSFQSLSINLLFHSYSNLLNCTISYFRPFHTPLLNQLRVKNSLLFPAPCGFKATPGIHARGTVPKGTSMERIGTQRAKVDRSCPHWPLFFSTILGFFGTESSTATSTYIGECRSFLLIIWAEVFNDRSVIKLKAMNAFMMAIHWCCSCFLLKLLFLGLFHMKKIIRLDERWLI